MKLVVVTPPTQTALTLNEAKSYLRLTHDLDDAALADFLPLVDRVCEQYQGRALLAQTVEQYLDAWPTDDVVRLYGPVRELTSIEVLDDDSEWQEVPAEDYDADLIARQPTVRPLGSWPTPADRVNAIKITLDVGYETPADVPVTTRQGLKQLVSLPQDWRHLAGMVAAGLPPEVRRWLDFERVRWLPSIADVGLDAETLARGCP